MSDSTNIDHPTSDHRVPTRAHKRPSPPPANVAESADGAHPPADASAAPDRVHFTPRQWAFGEAEEGVL